MKEIDKKNPSKYESNDYKKTKYFLKKKLKTGADMQGMDASTLYLKEHFN